MDGGSGGNYNQIYFTSMFSLHNTRNIKIEKIKLINHSDYDDMIHVIYCENVLIDKAELINAFGDAIDIDLSKNITIIIIQLFVLIRYSNFITIIKIFSGNTKSCRSNLFYP